MAGDALESTQGQLSSSLEPPVHDDPSCQGRRTTFDAGAVVLRSRQPPVTFEALELGGLEARNPTFRGFRAKLAAWLTEVLPLYGFSFAPGCMRVEFQADDKVSFASDLVFWLIAF